MLLSFFGWILKIRQYLFYPFPFFLSPCLLTLIISLIGDKLFDSILKHALHWYSWSLLLEMYNISLVYIKERNKYYWEWQYKRDIVNENHNLSCFFGLFSFRSANNEFFFVDKSDEFFNLLRGINTLVLTYDIFTLPLVMIIEFSSFLLILRNLCNY